MSTNRENDADAAQKLSAELRGQAATLRSWPNRLLRFWPLMGIPAVISIVLAMLRAPGVLIVAVLVSPFLLALIAILGGAFRWARLAAKSGLHTDQGRSFAASALIVLLVLAANALYVLGYAARPPLGTVLRWLSVPFFVGLVLLILLSPPVRLLMRAIVDPELRREVIGYLRDRDALWRDAAQERAEQSGLVGRAFPTPTAAEWPAIVEAARAHRDTLRAILDQMLPQWVYSSATALAALMFGPGAIIVGVVGIVTAITGSAWSAANSPTEIVRTILIGAAVTALAVYMIRRRASYRAALKKTAGGLRGQLLEKRHAGKRLLDWLDERNWGPAPHLIWLSERGERYAIEGQVGGHPVFVSLASRYGVPRWLNRLWIDSPDDLPTHHLTKVFVALPSTANRELSPETDQRCREAGFSTHVARDGVRLSRNDAEPAHVAPDVLLPLLDLILDERGLVDRKEGN